MTREERNNKIVALKLNQRKAAKEMMKIYRRRRRIIRAILCLTKYACTILIGLFFIMLGITIDPLYTGNMHSTWFVIATILIIPIAILAENFNLMLKNAKR